jgi:hypothetical protein
VAQNDATRTVIACSSTLHGARERSFVDTKVI